jgi:N-acetylneuraminic acid mutarotase
MPCFCAPDYLDDKPCKFLAIFTPKLRTFAFLIAGISTAAPAFSQTNEWTWVGGNSTIPTCPTLAACGRPGVYGMLGVPAPENTPGGRDDAMSWTDQDGNFWIFGGSGDDADGNNGTLNDLWKFDAATSDWTWMGGDMLAGPNDGTPGVYGALGKASPKNIPGGRYGSETWTDSFGRFWLFGGDGADAVGHGGSLNDLWMFDPSTNEWTWMGGSSQLSSLGRDGYGGLAVYGTLKVPSEKNIPGGRSYAVTWTDRNDNLWMFGGSGFDANKTDSFLNDLWRYNPSTKEWTWMGGSNKCCQDGSYGTLGKPSAENSPGSRWWSVGWVGEAGNLWLFGGLAQVSTDNGNFRDLNDLWKFDPVTNEWTWMGGSSSAGSSCVFYAQAANICGWKGRYGKNGVPASGNYPGSRESAIAWSDLKGHLWLFGGLGFDSSGNRNYLNDLWAFDPLSMNWTWMSGSTQANAGGVPGTEGDPAARNVPGARVATPVTPGRSDRLWLFAGLGNDAKGAWGYLNDLWEYSPLAPLSPAATPIFSPKPGIYAGPLRIFIAATPGATIYYTLNGGDPTNKSTRYKGGIKLTETTKIRAIAEADGFLASAVASATYTIRKAQTITFPPIHGSYVAGTKIGLEATASSKLLVTFASESPKICSVSAQAASLLAAGTCVIRASQAGNSIFAAAPPVTQRFQDVAAR